MGAGDQGLGLKLEPGAPPTARLTSSSDEVMGSFPMYRNLQARLWMVVAEGASRLPASFAHGHGPVVLHMCRAVDHNACMCFVWCAVQGAPEAE